ncbi:response regulator, partial [Pseudomonas moraviensis]|uniref:response regulator n=1 Tax=Pseudomonas moraviensis TaxID=321662 RepID=UPI000F467458
GAHALALWGSRPFGIVITDCNVAVMSGYGLARTIRQDERDSGGGPCIVLGFTANAQPEEKVKCREAGMDDCLFKPISLSTLSTMLAGWEKNLEPEPVESPPAATVKELGSIRGRLDELTG